ncbi:MAG: L,D-transpeptidase family protein [Pseudomonadota bacterium]
MPYSTFKRSALGAILAVAMAVPAMAEERGLGSGLDQLIQTFGAPTAMTQAEPTQLASTEWSDGFDPTGGRAFLQAVESSPLVGDHAAPALFGAINTYSQIVQRGGWNSVPTNGPTLKRGSRHKNVVAVRERLIATGDMDASLGKSSVFDTYVERAVKRFQERHGIVANGVVREDTITAMNVSADSRLRQLRSNLNRLNAAADDLGERYIMVNIPAAEIEAVQSGFVVSRHTAVVGKIDRQTPLLSSRVHEINFNPYWTVPKSIIRRDLIPTMQKDPEYLTRYNIRIFDTSGNEIQPLSINWETEEAVDYLFRQDPGEINSLGSVKINFYNKHAVYLHDTPTKGLFASNFRFHSSGCVRVQNVRELVNWILRDNGDWSRRRIDTVIRTGERIDVDVQQPVPLHMVYITAWANTDGTIHFRDDIYKQDGLLETAAFQ